MAALLPIVMAEVPWVEGVRVFAFGLTGVFVGLAALAAVISGLSLVIRRLERKEEPKTKES